MTKACSCGAVYEMDTWELLALVGYWPDPPLKLELRNCGRCKLTLGVLVDDYGNYVEAHPYDELAPPDCSALAWALALMYAGSMKLGMTVGEAVEAWGCPESTIRRWATEGHIEAQKVGRDWLILSSDPPSLSRGRPPKQPDSQKN